MLSVKKLTEYSKAHMRPLTIKRMISINRMTAYQPKSRFEKIRSTGLVYPASTPSKIVFVSNSHGNGFRDEKEVELPSHVDVQRMKEQIDRVCYEKWRDNKRTIEMSAFESSERTIKLLCAATLFIIAVLFLEIVGTNGDSELDSLTQVLVWASLLLTVACTTGAVVIYSKENEQFDFDRAIITAIKNKLALLNLQEIESTQDNPSFRWTCNKDCTWVALEIFPEQY